MSQGSFEELDNDFMKQLRTEREKSVAPAILKGFSASVLAKIEQKNKKPAGARLIAPVLVPAFAMILLASVFALKNPSFQMPSAQPYMDMMLAGTADLSDEISAFEELGVWGDEDQEILGVSDLDAAPE